MLDNGALHVGLALATAAPQQGNRTCHKSECGKQAARLGIYPLSLPGKGEAGNKKTRQAKNAGCQHGFDAAGPCVILTRFQRTAARQGRIVGIGWIQLIGGDEFVELQHGFLRQLTGAMRPNALTVFQSIRVCLKKAYRDRIAVLGFWFFLLANPFITE
jgi:hypothetical protein